MLINAQHKCHVSEALRSFTDFKIGNCGPECEEMWGDINFFFPLFHITNIDYSFIGAIR